MTKEKLMALGLTLLVGAGGMILGTLIINKTPVGKFVK